jgi:hypothetical protein
MVTVTPEFITKTPVLALPSTARLSAPGPEIVILLSTMSSPVVNVIAPVTLNVISSPSFASASASRNEPVPLSFVFVTTMFVAGD